MTDDWHGIKLGLNKVEEHRDTRIQRNFSRVPWHSSTAARQGRRGDAAI